MSVTLNKYADINVEELSTPELGELRRGLECDISWTEHDLRAIDPEKGWGEKTDLLLDNLQIYNNLYKKVLEKLK